MRWRGLSDGERILEDDLDAPALLLRAAPASPASGRRRSARCRAGREEPATIAGRGALAAARLADQAERLAGRDRERHVVERRCAAPAQRANQPRRG
jgi:hypothetical protein